MPCFQGEIGADMRFSTGMSAWMQRPDLIPAYHPQPDIGLRAVTGGGTVFPAHQLRIRCIGKGTGNDPVASNLCASCSEQGRERRNLIYGFIRSVVLACASYFLRYTSGRTHLGFTPFRFATFSDAPCRNRTSVCSGRSPHRLRSATGSLANQPSAFAFAWAAGHS